MMKQVLLFLMVFCAVNGRGQIITTIAGCDTCSGSDGRPATLTALNDPGSGVFDKYGNYYFVQDLGKKVSKIGTDGIIHTIAGTGTSGAVGDGGLATSAHLIAPNAVAFDTLGNIYISDGAANRIRKIDILSGIITTVVGNGIGGFYGDNGSATAAKIWNPQDICFDKLGNLYISDAFNYRIRKVNTHGIISTIAGTGGLGPLGDEGPATDAVLNVPCGIVSDIIGNVYVADASTCRVRKIDTAGIIHTIAGNGTATYIGEGIPATNAQMNPIKMTFDSLGYLLISDKLNKRVYRIDQYGSVYTIAGNGMSGFSGDFGMATSATIDYPGGIAFDPCWNLYICQINIPRIRKVTYNLACNILDIPLGLTSVDNLEFTSQNPIIDKLIISGQVYEILITNLTGQTLFTQTYTSTKAEIDMSGYPAGVYIVRVRDKNGGQIVRKVVKE